VDGQNTGGVTNSVNEITTVCSRKPNPKTGGKSHRNRIVTNRRIQNTMASDPPTADHDAGGEAIESINEFAVIGEFGFQRVSGPFSVTRSGTNWVIVVPEDAHPTVSTLPDQEGEAAAIVADGEIAGGGIITQVARDTENSELHITVDQYAQGNPNIDSSDTDTEP
jgi:hypothetical protein